MVSLNRHGGVLLDSLSDDVFAKLYREEAECVLKG